MSSPDSAPENGEAVPDNSPPEVRVGQNFENVEAENQVNQVADHANEQQIANPVNQLVNRLFVYWIADDLLRMNVGPREPVVVRQNDEIGQNLMDNRVVGRNNFNFADSVITSRLTRNDRSRG